MRQELHFDFTEIPFNSKCKSAEKLIAYNPKRPSLFLQYLGQINNFAEMGPHTAGLFTSQHKPVPIYNLGRVK